MNRLEYFKRLQQTCQAKTAFHGQKSFWQYLSDSLQYLIDVEEGTTDDRSRLGTISIGGVAVHENVGDDVLVEELCMADVERQKMINEK